MPSLIYAPSQIRSPFQQQAPMVYLTDYSEYNFACIEQDTKHIQLNQNKINTYSDQALAWEPVQAYLQMVKTKWNTFPSYKLSPDGMEIAMYLLYFK